jgi:hypothetical protein
LPVDPLAQMARGFVALCLLSLACSGALAANICGENRTIGLHVMAVLNLSYPGLEAVAAAERSGDLDGACEALAAYYAAANTSSWLRIPPVAPGTGRVGNGSLVDNAVDRDYIYMAGVDTGAVIPRNPDGGFDWTFKGPRDDVVRLARPHSHCALATHSTQHPLCFSFSLGIHELHEQIRFVWLAFGRLSRDWQPHLHAVL